MKQGAYDYVTKPFKVDELRLVVEKALEKRLLAAENQRLRSALRKETGRRHLVGSSRAMQQLYEMVARVADTRTNVLIQGESGTGKELVARAIHDQSERREQPFVAVNCGAIPENLLESELFGHVKGAFTGAVQSKPGLFETAHRGTLFLDEIGELPPALQVKLLRVLQDRAVRRVGGTSDHQVDVRIVAATNRRLEEEVAAGRFREDLYYRLNVIQIGLPPLRERPEDIPLLVQHFVERYASEVGKAVRGFSDAALERLAGHAFPGNVRELENLVERAVALSTSETIGPESLPPSVLEPASKAAAPKLPLEGSNLDSLVNEFERGLLEEALRQARGVKKRAAGLLGISFRSFRYRLEKLGMDEPTGEE
jgi:two-component system, NtrC family, response regulator PilR